MAKNDNLNDFLADVANAIRLKKGTTDLINPQDFSAEISSISGSGGGGSTMEYLDISGLSRENRGLISIYGAMLARGIKKDVEGNGGLCVCSIAAFVNGSPGYADWGESISAIAIDFSREMILANEKMTVGEISQLLLGVIDLASIPRLTKEQFYSLE